MLCTFEHDRIVFTPFYQQLDVTVATVRPRLLILDTLADFFAGDYLSTPHARQFIRTGLRGLSARHDCAVLLLAHPSQSGMNSGEGSGFSTAWNNAVRSRLYLRRPKTADPEDAQYRRVLELRKSNYAPSGVMVPLLWQPGVIGYTGVFVPDSEPIEEPVAHASRPAKIETRLAIAAWDYLRAHALNGWVVGFRTLLEALQASGALPPGDYQKARKPLGRALSELQRAGSITACQIPRGYRLAERPSEHSGDNTGTTRGHECPRTPAIRGHPYKGCVPGGPERRLESCPRKDASMNADSRRHSAPARAFVAGPRGYRLAAGRGGGGGFAFPASFPASQGEAA